MIRDVRVVKVGGSLLDLPDLESRLENWLANQVVAHYVLLAGGGNLVDEVRRWNTQWPVDDEEAHWICVDLMSATIRLVQSRFPAIPLTNDECSLAGRLDVPGATFFDVSKWLRESEPQLQGQVLPTNWDVTSDSIAARLAICLGATELMLLKSCLSEEKGKNTIFHLSASGIIDPAMNLLVEELPQVRIVNLLVNPPEETIIRTLAPHSQIL